MRLPCSHLDIPPALLFCSEDSHKALRNGATGHTGRQVRLSGSRARIGLCLADAHSVPAEPVDTRVAPIAVEGSACRALAFLFEPSKGFFRCGPVGPLVRFVLCLFFLLRSRGFMGGGYIWIICLGIMGVVVAVRRPREIAVVTIRYSSTGRPRRK